MEWRHEAYGTQHTNIILVSIIRRARRIAERRSGERKEASTVPEEHERWPVGPQEEEAREQVR